MQDLKTISNDKVCRFIFQDKDVRGLWVRVKKSFAESIENRNYPSSINRLLGEMSIAAQMLITNLKIKGTIIIQFQAGKILQTLMSSANNENVDADGDGIFNMRNAAILNPDFDGDINSLTFRQLVEDTTFVIGVLPKHGHPYNGMVEIIGEDLASCLEGYFINSEQIKTSIKIFSDEQNFSAAGIMIQELPSANVEFDDFQHLDILTQTASADEMLKLNYEEMLYRLYNEEKVVIFPLQSIEFRCNCNREKCETIIQMLPAEDLQHMLKEDGINFDCPCGKSYLITPPEIEKLRADDNQKNKNFELTKRK